MESSRDVYIPTVGRPASPVERFLKMSSFISPAIASPDNIDINVPHDDSGVTRRGLRQVARVVCIATAFL